MIKAELVTEIAAATGYSRREVSEVLEASMSIIEEKVSAGENIYLRGFGTFQTKVRKEKIARNISKQMSIVVPEHKVPAFKPSKEFTNKLN